MAIYDEFMAWSKIHLTYTFFGNTVQKYVLALLLFILLFIAFKIFKRIVISKFHSLAKKTKNNLDDELVGVMENISPLFYYIIALYFPLKMLAIDPTLEKVVDAVFIITLVYQAIKVLQLLIEYGFGKMANNGKIKVGETAFAGIRIVVKILLWSVGTLLVLSNLGFNITSLIAGLSIGGLAVAFAVQNILADVFSSFSIYFDKPFKIGDYIQLGQDGGTVKKIGLKTTRIETLQGEELIVSNQELTSAKLQNFRRMKRRRIIFKVGVTYDTPTAKLKNINGMIKKVIDKIKMAEFERSHFIEFGDFSLNFEVSFFVLSSEKIDALDTKEAVNFGIKEAFDKSKIEIAFPTQTLYVEK